ncbi:hypothetical protein N657DRAFT_599972 [Parathielavia appendiculata]|uniref:Uncharacterized protein n=1 Tax=Parathielavia appendiculata TaxID=2587402 RepID=A0AAN6TWD3_9PEZI|nr:hypothetical protein N657DRAFT_599972 [Parathielavia appendiculata]
MSVPSSPGGGGQPLQPVSHNAQRDSALFSPSQQQRITFGESASARDSSVHEKINQYNNLAMQTKQLERKTADAALKRAMLGREEAEAEMRRYRDEVRQLRKQVEEGKDRERRVGERLEAVMENYGRVKETHAHTQQLWEKEIRRARKETFKVQSSLVKAQEELKSCRTAQKAAEDELKAERERSKAREQEAFDAQYKLVSLQAQLDQAQQRIRMLEHELDAIKTLAKNEVEVKRLASEDSEDGDNSTGPRKRARTSSISALATSDPEIETITMLWEWEKQRADRALEQVQFLEAECQLKICSAAKEMRRNSSSRRSSPRRKRTSVLTYSDAGDPMILSESRRASVEAPKPTPRRSKTDMLKAEREPRRSTIFYPAEGIFRTVSQAEADAIAAKSAASYVVSPTESAPSMPITPTDSEPMYRRTPSVDPPDYAVVSKERTSLLSLLDAPHRRDPSPVFNIPTTAGPAPEAHSAEPEDDTDAPSTVKPTHLPLRDIAVPPLESSSSSLTDPLTDPLPSHITTEQTIPFTRPHTTSSHYPTTTATVTTTRVPLREEPTDGPTLAQRLMKMQRTPSRQTGNNINDVVDLDKPSFDATNPALTPTMTREQALAQIRERRGRARSVGRVGSNGSNFGSNTGLGSGSNAAVGTGGGSLAEARRMISGGGGGGEAAGGVVRRKVSSGELVSGRRIYGGEVEERGREREVRREVSAPTPAGGAAAVARTGTVRGLSAARRVRS